MTRLALNGESILSRSERVAWREIDGEGVLLDPKRGMVSGLNDSACVLWESLDGVTALGKQVQTYIIAEFDVSYEDALRDAVELMSQLMEDGLVVRSA